MSASGLTRAQTFRIAVRKFGPFEEAIRAQWDAFEQNVSTGLTLEMVPLDLQPLERALFESRGMSHGEWDAAFVATDWIAAMEEQGCAVDLTPYLESDPPPDYPEGWSPSLLRLQQIDGKILGVPYHDGPECLMYRHDLFGDPELRGRFFEQHGRELAPPITWAEFHQIARFFHRPAGRLYGTVFAAFPDGHNSVYDFLLQLWTRGGELTDLAQQIRLTTPEAEDALTFYRAILRDADAIHPESAHLDSVGAGLRFAAGEVAMMVNWFGFATHAHVSPESSVRGLVDVAHIPRGEGGQSASLNVYWILAMPSGTPHREIAWKFLRHTQTPAMDKLTTTNHAIGCRLSTWKDPGVQATIPFYDKLETLHHHAHEIPQRSDWPRIANIIDKLVTRAITTEIPIRTLLQEAQASLG